MTFTDVAEIVGSDAAARIAKLYSREGCYIGSDYERRIVAWMTENDIPAYAFQIAKRQIRFKVKRQAGASVETLQKLNNEIREEFEAAVERYTDWATD